MIDDDRLDLLVLVRVGRGAKGLPAARVASAIRPLLEHALSAGEAGRRIDDRLAALADRGLIEPRGRAWRVTDAGLAHVRGGLGVARLPVWRSVGARLAASALGIAATDAGAQIAALVADTLGVPRAKTPMAAVDAAIASRLGMAPGRVTLTSLRAHVLATAGAGKGATPEVLARRLAAGAVRSTGDAASIQRALVQRWLAAASVSGPPAAAPAPSPAPPTEPPTEPTLAEFATAIRAAAGRAEGRFGKKAFIAAAWRELVRDPRFAGLDLDRAKQLLLAANRDGLVELTRADLVAAMDPALVAASLIDDLGSTFHFVTQGSDGTGG
jgi:hypothetical protein